MIDGIVLAAGRSRRFGAEKLLVPYRGRSLVCHSVVAGLDSRLSILHVVLPPGADELASVVAACGKRGIGEEAESRVRITHVPREGRGMMASLQVGLRAVMHARSGTQEAGTPADDGDPGGAMVILADMPFVTANIINRLIATFEHREAIVVPTCAGAARHPRIVPRRLFEEFMSLGEHERGTLVIDRHPEMVCRVDVGHPDEFRDIDVPDDLE